MSSQTNPLSALEAAELAAAAAPKCGRRLV